MKKGFTLAEVVIALAIMSSVAGIGAARYMDFNERQVLQQAALNLKSNLRLAQHRALSGEKDPTICGNTRQLDGWCISPSSNNYSIYGVCGPLPNPQTFPAGTPNYPISSEVALETWVRQNNIWCHSGVDAGCLSGKLLFQPLAQGADFASPLITEVSYCLVGNLPSLVSTNNKYRIRITSGGEIIDDGIQGVCHP